MKPLTPILAVLLLVALNFSDSVAQPPARLLPAKLQDLSAGLEQEALAAPMEPGADYFEQEQEPSEPPESDLEAEQIPASEDLEADDEQRKAEAARQRATRSHLELLKKPIQDIALSAGVNRTEVPDNRAASFVVTQPETLITSSGVVSLPERYTICITHRPLYYEELNLERCGKHHGCLQSVCSGFKFFSSTLLLAYKMGRICPDQLVRSPGDCKTCESFPVTLKALRKHGCDRHGLLSEAAALAGFSLLLL